MKTASVLYVVLIHVLPSLLLFKSSHGFASLLGALCSQPEGPSLVLLVGQVCYLKVLFCFLGGGVCF